MMNKNIKEKINNNNSKSKVKFPDVKSEGILQIDVKENKKTKRKPRGFYSNKTVNELVDYTKNYLKANKITRIIELQKRNCSLYNALRERKLLNSIFGPNKKKPHGFYSKISDEKLIKSGKDFCKENNLIIRTQLYSKNRAFYNILCERKLLDSIFGVNKKKSPGFYSNKLDDELIKYSKEYCKENGIKIRKEIQIKNISLYHNLRKRGFLDLIFGSKNSELYGFYSKMSDEQLIEHSKIYCKKHNFSKRTELAKKNKTLYKELCKHKLVDLIFGSLERKPNGFYSNKTDEELIKYGKDFCKKNKIKSRSELEKKNGSLYIFLLKRKLLDSVFPEQSHLEDLVDAIRNFGAGFDDE
jgi:hypothetical protein